MRLLSSLLDQGSELAEPEREVWLTGLDGEAARLRPSLRKMLARDASVETRDILERLPAFTAPGGNSRASDFREGDSVGPYRLLRQIGRGGMGEVWLAARSDGHLKRNVALKLPMLSARRSVLAQRFERERDILAALVHPNIARLYDAGLAEDGQPFMALEYVEGMPITLAADEKALDAKGRVQLLRQVMDAVQYAHGNLVIHRDLKPGNVLVTAGGSAKLLDFGIAKLVEDEATAAAETELTRLGGRALTPHYAAPEQLAGRAVSTAADVWALGVLLYEMLTGLRPFGGDSRGAIEQDILTREPTRPSHRRSGAAAKVARSLAGDLDTIVLKALKKNPAERYGTVGALADDLDRWLRGEPVQAQADSAWYRARKFVGRHKLAVATATLAAIAMIGTASVAVVFGLQSREESARAIAARDFMTDLFRQTDPDLLQGKEISARQLLAQGYKMVVETMRGQPALQAELLRALGDASQFQGDWPAADAAYAQAALLLQPTGNQRDAAAILLDRAQLRLFVGWNLPATPGLLAQAKSIYAAHSNDDEFMARYAIFQAMISDMGGNTRQLRVWHDRAVPHAARSFRDNSTRTVSAIRSLAGIEGMVGAHETGIERLHALVERLKKDKGVPPAWRVGVLDSLAFLEGSAGRFRASMEALETADAICRHASYQKGIQCIFTQYLRANVLLGLGYHERAMETVPILLHGTDAPGDKALWSRIYMLHAYRVLATNKSLDGYPALRAEVRGFGDSSEDKAELWKSKLLALEAQARMLLDGGQLEQAQRMCDRLQLLIAAKQLGNHRYAFPAYVICGMTANALGQHEIALKSLDMASARRAETVGASHPFTQIVSIHRARPLWATGRRDEALAVLDRALPILREAMGADAPAFVKLKALRDELATASPETPQARRKVEIFM